MITLSLLAFLGLLIASVYLDAKYTEKVANAFFDGITAQGDHPYKIYFLPQAAKIFTAQKKAIYNSIQFASVLLPAILQGYEAWTSFFAYAVFFLSLYWIAFDPLRKIARGVDIFYPSRQSTKDARDIRFLNINIENALEIKPYLLVIPKILLFFLGLAFIEHIEIQEQALIPPAITKLYLLTGGIIFLMSFAPNLYLPLKVWVYENRWYYLGGFALLITSFVVLTYHVNPAAFGPRWDATGTIIALLSSLFALYSAFTRDKIKLPKQNRSTALR